MKLIIFFLSEQKFTVSVEGEISTLIEIQVKGALGFRPVPYIVQYVHKWYI
jgi:hypothetical protein